MRRRPVPYTGPRRLVLSLPRGCSAELTVTNGNAVIITRDDRGKASRCLQGAWTPERIAASGDEEIQEIAALAAQQGLPPTPTAFGSEVAGSAVSPSAPRIECGCGGMRFCRVCGGKGFAPDAQAAG